ncbi:MAG TPA: tRNA (guanosine(46)-N7)-methyltransferase TrmB [Afifellaceae bacterium]|nr:tRNA (guanosine(46)-N7)-methyltransferase TrmB [Afifellaceae bacterium]
MTPHRRDSFFGRRKGKPLRPGQRALMDGLLPRLRIDVAEPAPVDPADLFPHRPASICLEIGFGGGEHLVGQAAEYPERGIIGVEPFENGMAKALAAIDRLGLDNVRLFDRDAAFLLDWLPAASLDRVDLLYPDPWPKKRHWKRRFVNQHNVDRIARVLRPGGLFRFASDIESYVNWTLSHLVGRDDFVWQAGAADDWRKPWPGWAGTRYEAKAVREGRVPAYLVFRRR